MSESPRERANRIQLAASNPAVSAFVAASAGSGKTKLLTDRLLRLMLGGASPERIQCLTFTKAAAAEMALRLQRRLGRWVTLADDALASELRALEVEPDEATLAAARALFARVLDLPGGMRIGTIHAFSQSLLRRFPLEAEISPHFQLVDERDAADALAEAREDMLAEAGTQGLADALGTLAGLASAVRFGEQVQALSVDRMRLDRALQLGPDLLAAQRRAVGLRFATETELMAEAVEWLAEHEVARVASVVETAGSPAVARKAAEMRGWLGLDPQERAENWAAWRGLFLTGDGLVRGPNTFVNPNLRTAQPDLLEVCLAEAERVRLIEDSHRALRLVAVSNALVRLAGPVVRNYADRKSSQGLLDYEDLIGTTSRLLVDPGAAWVLYKLDGGLDHLLLDEVQDTSPAQWGIAHALTAEFFTGLGARDDHRTVFAVGDPKQSIYSFQGADTAEFERSRRLLARRVADSGHLWQDTGLDVSFRSVAPVLALVDAVFADPAAAAGVVDPDTTLRHQAERAGHAGVVELWPLTPVPEGAKPAPWTVPETNQGMTSAPQALAEALADWIKAQTDGSVMLESRGRPLAPGDVMVLVRRRNAFARALVRALKARGVPVAGLDRLVLTEQPAVQDLMALCDALLLPQDDLTFACFLTSPLGGLDDDDLMALAVGRRGSLWDTLRARATEHPRWTTTAEFFAPLLGRVDYASPHALLAEALGPLGGRARLFRRLGPEAAEPVDELLNIALTYGASHPSSLQGFLHWLRLSGAEVKREAEAAGDLVRVMTAHGAKGLQAPLVILPDTTALPPDDGVILWTPDPATGIEVPLWCPRREFRCDTVEGLRGGLSRSRMEEHNRLLYVALTRAEDRLVVCGWQTRRAAADTCWYKLVERGFAALGAEQVPFGRWPGDIQRLGTPQTAPHGAAPPAAATAQPVVVPAWLGSAPEWRPVPPPPEPLRPRPLAPSRPEGVEHGSVPAAVSPLVAGGPDRFRRGQVVHALLQHLPGIPETERKAAAERYLSREGSGIPVASRASLVAEVLAVLTHPELTPLFGPEGRPEVPLIGVVGDAVVGGLVDRLAILPDRVLIVDFKTNRDPPATAGETPVMYLRQMASYRAVLRAILPDRKVHCALVWTRETRVMPLPEALLDPYAPSA